MADPKIGTQTPNIDRKDEIGFDLTKTCKVKHRLTTEERLKQLRSIKPVGIYETYIKVDPSFNIELSFSGIKFWDLNSSKKNISKCKVDCRKEFSKDSVKDKTQLDSCYEICVLKELGMGALKLGAAAAIKAIDDSNNEQNNEE